jgi:phosphomannomutase
MIRPSGTEPVLRTYAEASTQAKVFDILADAKATIL